MGTLNQEALHSSSPSYLSDISVNRVHTDSILLLIPAPSMGTVRKMDRFRLFTSQIYSQYSDSKQMPYLHIKSDMDQESHSNPKKAYISQALATGKVSI